jgi:NADPH:quinone reductase-like Zn-dependent oxidoreductase
MAGILKNEPDPSENEVVIKVAYAAVNPTDWKARKSS